VIAQELQIVQIPKSIDKIIYSIFRYMLLKNQQTQEPGKYVGIWLQLAQFFVSFGDKIMNIRRDFTIKSFFLK